MKKIILIFVISSICLSGCDPFYHLYFENKSGKTIIIEMDKFHESFPYKLSPYPEMNVISDNPKFCKKVMEDSLIKYRLTLQPNELLIIDHGIGYRPGYD